MIIIFFFLKPWKTLLTHGAAFFYNLDTQMVAYIFWPPKMGSIFTRSTYYSTKATPSNTSCCATWNLFLHNNRLAQLAAWKTQVNIDIFSIVNICQFDLSGCCNWLFFVRKIYFRLVFDLIFVCVHSNMYQNSKLMVNDGM